MPQRRQATSARHGLKVDLCNFCLRDTACLEELPILLLRSSLPCLVCLCYSHPPWRPLWTSDSGVYPLIAICPSTNSRLSSRLLSNRRRSDSGSPCLHGRAPLIVSLRCKSMRTRSSVSCDPPRTHATMPSKRCPLMSEAMPSNPTSRLPPNPRFLDSLERWRGILLTNSLQCSFSSDHDGRENSGSQPSRLPTPTTIYIILKPPPLCTNQSGCHHQHKTNLHSTPNLTTSFRSVQDIGQNEGRLTPLGDGVRLSRSQGLGGITWRTLTECSAGFEPRYSAPFHNANIDIS